MLPRYVPPAIIAALGLAFFAELALHPTRTLYAPHTDFVAQYVPLKRFLVRSWQETGELPLWCPDHYSGLPFVHDIQVCAFYPPHVPLYWLPDRYVGCAMSWLVVLHVVIAGWCMYAYARADGLGQGGALVAAAGYMFAGKWLLHLLSAGHSNLTPLAWLPLVLLGLERAIRRGGLLPVLGAGTAFGLIALGTHPQFTFYAGLFTALWTLGPTLETAGRLGGRGPRSWRRTAGALARWALCGLGTVAVAGALAAVQLLPTLEATRETGRGNTAFAVSSVIATLWSLLRLVGPPPAEFGWEHQGGLGVAWLMVAALAASRGRPLTRFRAVVGLLLVAFALGGWVIFNELPGFRFFRIPTRMVTFAALPLALLAGIATDALFRGALAPAGGRALPRPVWIWLGIGLALLAGQVAFAAVHDDERPRCHLYWAVLPVAVGGVLGLLWHRPAAPSPAWKAAWVACLVAELWALGWPQVDTRPEEELLAPSACVRSLIRPLGHGRVLDRDVDPQKGDSPLGHGLPLLLDIEAVRGYNPLDVYRYKQYLHFIGDDDQAGTAANLVGDVSVRNRRLLDLLGVRYLLQPSGTAPDGPGWEAVMTDPHPRVFSFTAGGVRDLPPYTVWENKDAFPRAFVVPRAVPLPAGRSPLAALKATDFRQTVLVEGIAAEEAGSTGGGVRTAEVIDYRPNRVTVAVEGDGGHLVLADLWYPGWECRVDGEPASLYRADYLFRATRVPPGRHEVVFTFAPASYRLGRLISLAAVSAVAAAVLVLAGWALVCRRRTKYPSMCSNVET